MRRTGSGWDRSFFWQFVNGTHGTADGLKRVVLLGMILKVFDAFVSSGSGIPFRPSLLLAGNRTRNRPHHLF